MVVKIKHEVILKEAFHYTDADGVTYLA